MKKLFVIVILPAIIVLLGYLVVDSILKPVRFNQEKNRREEVAKDRLKDIRTLQTAYKSKFGQFTENMDTLIHFYNAGKITITKQVGSMDDSLAVAQNRVFRENIDIPVRDTLRSILKYRDRMIDSLRWIPFSQGKPIQMEALIRSVSGVPVPLFEASAPYDLLLLGMDRQLVVNLKADRVAANRFPGLRVGSIEAPNNNAGNWE